MSGVFISSIRRFKIKENFNNQKANNSPEQGIKRMHVTIYGGHIGASKQ